MLHMDFLGWIVVGFSPARSRARCRRQDRTRLPARTSSSASSAGSSAAGWPAQMGFGQVQGFIAALVVAVFGALVVRLVLNAISAD